jgi:hypothetical protein
VPIEIGELRGIISLQDLFSGPAAAVKGKIGDIGESFSAVTQFAGIAATAVGATVGAIVALGTRGAAVADVEDAFRGLTARAGESADVMLGALQEGTLGTISNFELMKMANSTLGSGLITSSADMKTLAAGAQLLGDRTGKGTAAAFETLTEAMAKGRTAGLKTLGVFVDSSVAVETYAKSLHKNVGDLTDHERATALSQATVAALNKELTAAGPPVADFGDLIDRGKVAVLNFTDQLGVAIARSPVVAAGLGAITGAVQSAFGSNQQETVKTLMGFVNRFAIGLVEAASVGVEAARFITNAFEGSKVLFNAFLELLFKGISAAAGAMADLAEKGKAIPIIGTQLAAAAVDLRGVADEAGSLAIGFGEMKDKGLDAAATLNAGFDGVKAFLGKTEEAMRATLSAEFDLNTGAAALTTGLGQTGQAAGLTKAQIAAMEEATRAAQNALMDMATNAALQMQTLDDQIALANKAGLDRQLLDIQQHYVDAMASYQGYARLLPEEYAALTAKVETLYGLQTAAAVESFTQQAAAAVNTGSTQRQAAEKTVAAAKANYDQLLNTGKTTYAQLAVAYKAWQESERALAKIVHEEKIAQIDTLARLGVRVLGEVFGQGKAAAIATAVLDGYAAVVKTLAAYPWPWSLIPAAAIAALTGAQIAKIRSSPGPSFAEGSPGTMFEDFGRGTMVTLHGHEAIITTSQAESVADMVRSAIAEGRSGASGGGGQPINITVPVYLGTRKIHEELFKASRTGYLRISNDAMR